MFVICLVQRPASPAGLWPFRWCPCRPRLLAAPTVPPPNPWVFLAQGGRQGKVWPRQEPVAAETFQPWQRGTFPVLCITQRHAGLRSPAWATSRGQGMKKGEEEPLQGLAWELPPAGGLHASHLWVLPPPPAHTCPSLACLPSGPASGSVLGSPASLPHLSLSVCLSVLPTTGPPSFHFRFSFSLSLSLSLLSLATPTPPHFFWL